MTESGGSYVFLTGADMHPTKVRAAYPEGRFVARGYAEVHAGQIAPEFAKTVASAGVADVWGILVQVPQAFGEGERRLQVTTDDGRTVTAIAVGDRLANGQAHAVLRAAQYWELPGGYVGRLKMAVPQLGKADAGDED